MAPGAQPVRPRRIKGAAEHTRMVRTGAQHVQPARIKGVDHRSHPLRGEPETARDLPAALPRGTRQHDPSTAQDKGIGRAQAIVQRLALRVGERTHRQGAGSTPTIGFPDRKPIAWKRSIVITEDEQPGSSRAARLRSWGRPLCRPGARAGCTRSRTPAERRPHHRQNPAYRTSRSA
jgi:hypothetical protein